MEQHPGARETRVRPTDDDNLGSSVPPQLVDPLHVGLSFEEMVRWYDALGCEVREPLKSLNIDTLLSTSSNHDGLGPEIDNRLLALNNLELGRVLGRVRQDRELCFEDLGHYFTVTH